MSYNSSVYNDEYYNNRIADGDYARGNGWEQIFARIANRIAKELAPSTVLDVGCAFGYLVEGLRDIGTEAYGIDISDYAISNVRKDIQPFCSVKSATEAIKKRYDLITCIEVAEHLAPEDFDIAIANICSASDTVIFSSTPFEFNEGSHYSVNSPGFWVEKFAYNGFYHDISYDCSYISVQAMLFRKEKKTNIDLIRLYEPKLFDLWRENCILRDSVNLANARIGDLDRGNIAHAQEVYDLNAVIEKKSSEIDEMTNRLNDKESLFIQYLQKKDMDFSEQLRQKSEELTLKYETMLKDQSDLCQKRIDDQKKRCCELLKLEYIKRDTVEGKLATARIRNQFLESELWKAKCEIQKQGEQYRNKLFIDKPCAEGGDVKTKISLKGKLSHCLKLLFSGKSYWNPVFNEEDYLKYNPDVNEKIPHTRKRLLWHFMRYGMKEGRRASEHFDVHVYRSLNPDVAAISQSNLKNAYYHYIEHGCKEHRRVCSDGKGIDA